MEEKLAAQEGKKLGKGKGMKVKTQSVFKQLEQLMDKNKCYDVFRNTKVANSRMYQIQSVKDTIYYSLKIRKLEQKLKHIRLMKSIGHELLSGYDNTSFIQATLEEIQIVKELFVL